jgi:nucleoside 2-deoxyribosyltransferase
VSVYIAGPVIETGEQDVEYPEGTVKETTGNGNEGPVLLWREEIFVDPNADSGTCGFMQAGELSVGRFQYAGPSIVGGHGYGYHELAKTCLAEVSKSDVLFAWIDRKDTVGTMVEIGAAHSLQKPIFVAFANQGLAKRFYFAKQLAAVAITAPDALAAWKMFVRWRDREDAYTSHDAAGETVLSAIGVLVGRKSIRTPRSQTGLTLEIKRLPGGLLAVDIEAEDELVAELSDLPDFLPSTRHGVKTNESGKRQHRFIYKDPGQKLP